jgi:hypothetical protein
VPDRLEESAVVEPVDPFERCELDLLEGSPRTIRTNDLGLGEAVDGLCFSLTGSPIFIACAVNATGRTAKSAAKPSKM